MHFSMFWCQCTANESLHRHCVIGKINQYNLSHISAPIRVLCDPVRYINLLVVVVVVSSVMCRLFTVSYSLWYGVLYFHRLLDCVIFFRGR